MKKLLFSVFLALVAVTTLFAAPKGKELLFTSNVTGITFHVPANVRVMQDELDAVILKTPDDEFIMTAEAFDVEEVSEDDITQHLVTMAEAAKMNLDEAEEIENETDIITLNGLAYDYENGGAAVVGVASVNDTQLGYYITVVASKQYVDYAVSSLLTISFNPDAIED